MLASRNFLLILLVILLSTPFSAFSQQSRPGGGANRPGMPGRTGSGIVTGTIFDKKTSEPIEVATIMLFNSKDSSAVTGGSTNSKGEFSIENVPSGTFYARISFIGFERIFTKDFVIEGASKIDLGKIYLSAKVINIDDVVVNAERTQISYQIDKKVINVGENITSLTGTATDILENVPSVTVDIDGNVSLRGNSNFTVLIDGRPTLLDGNTVLQQMPASTIENIEIITNPSAKYNPEGTAGIINLVMKKNKLQGISGIAGINAGLKDKYGAEFMGDYKTGGTQLNFGINYNKRSMSSTDVSRNWTNNNGFYSYYNSTGDSYRNMEYFGLRGGASWDLGDKNIFTIGGRYSDRTMGNNSNSNYEQWTTAQPDKNLYRSLDDGERSGNDIELSSSYVHPFNTNGHELSIDMDYEIENGDDYSKTNLVQGMVIKEGKISTESGPGNQFQTKIDYIYPIDEKSKFEAGYNGELEYSNEKNDFKSYNLVTGQYDFNPLFSNDVKYYTDQHALYSIYSNQLGDFGFKVGARAEYTGRDVKIDAKNQNFSISDWDYFPTAHFSYDLGSGNQLMTSYTRRIRRPRGWEFEPFITWQDAYNVRSGNPDILPEYIDSYELGAQKVIGNSLISIDSYFRMTHNKTDRIQSFYSENVTLTRPENIGKDYSIGAELFFNFDPIENWNVNLMGNLYNYKIEGAIRGKDFSRNSFNWNFRFNNTIKFTSSTVLQFNAMYNSPSTSSQGKRDGFFMTNIAVKQTLFEKLLTISLNVRDLFGTSNWESTNESFDFYNFRSSEREAPMLMLNFRFNINNYKNREQGDDGMTIPEE